MSRKSISDIAVLQAYVESKEMNFSHRIYPDEILKNRFNEPEKVVYSAMLRACKKDFIDYGVSLRCGWITEKGFDFINKKSIYLSLFY